MRNETPARWEPAGGAAATAAVSPPTAAVALAPPPQHLFGDYVEMVYLGLVILVGTSINVYVLHKLLRERKRGKHNVGFLLLKINLNLSDLLILVVHAFGKLIWLAEYEWRFGVWLCRLFNFFSMFTLYLSSNIVVCIALDRLRTVVQARKPVVSRKQQLIIRIMVALAWLLALIWSLPQLYFWRTINVFPEYPGGWIQCSDIWSIERYEIMRNANYAPAASIFISDFTQNLYDLTHLCFVFYGPLVLLIVCYLFILVKLLRFARSTESGADLENKQKSGASAPSSTPVPFAYRTAVALRKSKTISHENINSCQISPSATVNSMIGASPNNRGPGTTPTMVSHNRTCRACIQKRFSLTLPMFLDGDPAGESVAPPPPALLLKYSVDKLSHHVANAFAGVGDASQVDGGAANGTSPGRPMFVKMPRRTPTVENGDIYRKISVPNGSAMGLLVRKARAQSLSRHDDDNCLDCESIGALSSSQSTLRTIGSPAGDLPRGGGALSRLRDALLAFVRYSVWNKPKWRAVRGKPQVQNGGEDDYFRPASRSIITSPAKNRAQSLVSSWNVNQRVPDKRHSYTPAVVSSTHNAASASTKRFSLKRFSSTNTTSTNAAQARSHSKTAMKIYRYARLQCGASRDKSKAKLDCAGDADSERFLSTSTLNNVRPEKLMTASDTSPRSPKRIPLWRRQMKSRMFRTTLLVIVTHVVLWLPYNSYALMKYINVDFYTRMNEKANVLKDLQFLITIINPFLYGFTPQ